MVFRCFCAFLLVCVKSDSGKRMCAFLFVLNTRRHHPTHPQAGECAWKNSFPSFLGGNPTKTIYFSSHEWVPVKGKNGKVFFSFVIGVFRERDLKQLKLLPPRLEIRNKAKLPARNSFGGFAVRTEISSRA